METDRFDRGIHRIGCQYWQDMGNGGTPIITCTCGLWAAERREMELTTDKASAEDPSRGT